MAKEHPPVNRFGRSLGVNTYGGWDLESSVQKERVSHATEGRRGNWAIHDSSIADYGRTFQPVIGSHFLSGLLRTRAQTEGFTSIVDLMASEFLVTEVVKDHGFKTGVAVSLGFPHEDASDRRCGPGKISMVNGDITSHEAWLKIRERMVQVTPSGFDLVISRPEGGLKDRYLPAHPILYYLLLQQMWSIAAPRSTLLFQTPNTHAEQSLHYFEQLKDAGFDVTLPLPQDNPTVTYPFKQKPFYGFPVRIEKQLDSPKRLPRPTWNGVEIPEELKAGMKLVGIDRLT